MLWMMPPKKHSSCSMTRPCPPLESAVTRWVKFRCLRSGSMNLKVWLTVCAALGCVLPKPLIAGPLEDGQAAFAQADYVTALEKWKLLAEQGNAVAQFRLGLMYAEGRGVSQNDAEALKWYGWAASLGYAPA